VSSIGDNAVTVPARKNISSGNQLAARELAIAVVVAVAIVQHTLAVTATPEIKISLVQGKATTNQHQRVLSTTVK